MKNLSQLNHSTRKAGVTQGLNHGSPNATRFTTPALIFGRGARVFAEHVSISVLQPMGSGLGASISSMKESALMRQRQGAAANDTMTETLKLYVVPSKMEAIRSQEYSCLVTREPFPRETVLQRLSTVAVGLVTTARTRAGQLIHAIERFERQLSACEIRHMYRIPLSVATMLSRCQRLNRLQLASSDAINDKFIARCMCNRRLTWLSLNSLRNVTANGLQNCRSGLVSLKYLCVSSSAISGIDVSSCLADR